MGQEPVVVAAKTSQVFPPINGKGYDGKTNRQSVSMHSNNRQSMSRHSNRQSISRYSAYPRSLPSDRPAEQRLPSLKRRRLEELAKNREVVVRYLYSRAVERTFRNFFPCMEFGDPSGPTRWPQMEIERAYELYKDYVFIKGLLANKHAYLQKMQEEQEQDQDLKVQTMGLPPVRSKSKMRRASNGNIKSEYKLNPNTSDNYRLPPIYSPGPDAVNKVSSMNVGRSPLRNTRPAARTAPSTPATVKSSRNKKKK